MRWICICHVLETEKILVFHRQPYYRYYYYISRMLPYQKKRRDCVIFFQPRALLQTYKEIFADFDIDESSNYIRHVI